MNGPPRVLTLVTDDRETLVECPVCTDCPCCGGERMVSVDTAIDWQPDSGPEAA